MRQLWLVGSVLAGVENEQDGALQQRYVREVRVRSLNIAISALLGGLYQFRTAVWHALHLARSLARVSCRRSV